MKTANSIFKIFLVALLLAVQVHFAYAQTAALLPVAPQQFFDKNGNPVTSGSVGYYIPGTSTPKMVWQDDSQTTPWANPITLNAGGWPPNNKGIYGNGTYRQILKDKNNNIISDQPTSATGSGGGSGTSVGDGNSVGTILTWSGMIAPNQYQFAYGQSLSRATYPELYQAITLATDVVCVGGNATLTSITDTSNIPVGAALEGNCIVAGSTVISKTINTVTLSIAANISTTTNVRFFPYGNGNGTTTFNAPDLRGKVIPGRTNMGGVTASNLTNTYYGSSPDAVGANGGTQSSTLAQSNLPNVNFNVSIPSGQGSHTHSYRSVDNAGGSANSGGGQIANSQSTISTGASTLPAMTGTAASGGSGTAFSLVQPSMTLNYIIKVTPDTSVSGLFGVASIGGMQGVIACGTGLVCAGNTISTSPILPVTNTDNVLYTAPYTNSVQINQTAYNAVRVSVREFGALGDGVTDDTTAIQNALNSSAGSIYFPTGTYKITGLCLTLSSAKTLYGDGTYESIFNATGCTNNALTISTGLSGVDLNNFAIIRSGGAVSGQDGIHFVNLTEQANLNNLRLEGNWTNLRLGITSYSFISKVLSNNAYSNGFLFTNADGAGGMQWYLFDTLSQQSNGDGYRVETITSNASVGTWTNAKTYANKGKGMRFVGSSGNPLQAIRLFGGFVGQDCDDEIYLDTYGSSTHTIEGMFIEIAGASSCGVNLSTSATNVGHGINLTSNNTAVALYNNNIIGNSYSGIASSSARVQIVGNNLRINGAAAVPGELAGISINSGNATITGNSSKGQSYGLVINSDNVVASGNDFTENTLAPILSAVNLVNSVVYSNLPSSAVNNFNVAPTSHGDSAYAMSVFDRLVYTSASLTAPRIWTLPAANSLSAGSTLTVSDLFGGVTSTNFITIARAGSDTINGGTSIILNNTYGSISLKTDGSSKWSLAVSGRSGNTTTLATTSGSLISGNCAKFDANGNIVDNGAVCGGGGGGSPGGSNTQVQFNSAGSFGGSANLTWVSPKLTLGSAGSTAGQLAFANATSGSITMQAPTGALGTPTLTVPAATDTLIGKATTDTLTNKTFDTAGAGNSFSINGLAATANTGTGSVVRATSPTLVTPTLGAASATSINGLGITSSTGTLTIANGKTLTASNSLTFSGTDGSSVAFGTGGTATYTSNNLSVFSSTTSSQLAGVISDETGTGALVFATSPVFSTNITSPIVIGGTGVSSSLTLQTTSGVGAGSDAILLKGGNNGAVTMASITPSGASSSGQLRIGTSSALQTNMIAAFKGAGNGVMTIGQDPGLTNYAGLWTTNGTPSGANYNFIADSTGADPLLYFNAPGVTGQMVFQTNAISIVQYDSAKHVRTMTPAPSLSSCGTSPVISGSDTAGEITMGTGSPTGCVLTFNVAHANPPYCTVTWQSNLASMQYAIAASTITLTQTATSSNKVNYVCYARSGG